MSNKIYYLAQNLSLESEDSTLSFGDKNFGAGYYKIQNPVHTVVYNLDDFTGTLKIQATLLLYPSENDWFDIADSIIDGDSSQINLETFNFTGNFTYLRLGYHISNGSIISVSYTF